MRIIDVATQSRLYDVYGFKEDAYQVNNGVKGTYYKHDIYFLVYDICASDNTWGWVNSKDYMPV